MIQTLPPSPQKTDKPRPKRAVTGGVPSSASSAATSTPPRPRRTMSQDQHQQVHTSSGRPKKEKKASTHADLIDMMDYSGVGPAMFHHDGPFDACAPSRNRYRTRAPMGVFEGEDSSPIEAPLPATSAPAPSSPLRPAHVRARSSTSATVAINPVYAPPSPQPKKSALAEAWGRADPEPFEEFSAGGASSMYAGRAAHSGGASQGSTAHGVGRSAYTNYWNENDTAQNTSRNARRARNVPPPQQIDLPGAVHDSSAYPLSDSPPGSPDGRMSDAPGSWPHGMSSPGPKRSKSLMQRIRTMRDNPNVPVTAPDPHAPDPVTPYSEDPIVPVLYGQDVGRGYAQPQDGGRAYAQAQDAVRGSTESYEPDREYNGGAPPPATRNRMPGSSLLNKLTRSPRQRSFSASPPVSPNDDSGYVFVHSPREKALPSIPHDRITPTGRGAYDYEKDGGYFDTRPPVTGGGLVTPGTPATTPGVSLGRKRSLLSKMKGVAKGGK